MTAIALPSNSGERSLRFPVELLI